MAKKVRAVVKLQIEGGRATPAPPVGPALAPHQVNLQLFTKQFNDRTSNQVGTIVPVVVTIYEDRSFSLLLRPLLRRCCSRRQQAWKLPQASPTAI